MADVSPTDCSPARRLRDAREQLLSEEAATGEAAEGPPGGAVAQSRPPPTVAAGPTSAGSDMSSAFASRPEIGGAVGSRRILRPILSAYGAALALTAAIGLVLLWLMD